MQGLGCFEPKRVRSAGQVKLGGSVRRECTPNSLDLSVAAISNTGGLPWLVKCLEVEDIHAPIKQTADSLLVEGFRVGSTSNRGAVVRSSIYPYVREALYVGRDYSLTRRPASLAVHNMDAIDTASNLLNVSQSLHNIIKVGGSSVGDLLGLPVSESIDKSNWDL